MRKINALLLCFVTFTQAPAQSQNPPALVPTGQPKPALTEFDLDFPGGTPAQLVAAIEKALSRPLNAIIQPEDGGRRLPPLKMSRVTVPKLFQALTSASTNRTQWLTPNISIQTSMGFLTSGGPENASETSVWTFFVQESRPPVECRFYLLTPYLTKNLTVDDVTTAIQTAWKLRGDSPVPVINFHKETQLLIAVGEGWRLDTIDAVLKALKPQKITAAAYTGEAATAEDKEKQ